MEGLELAQAFGAVWKYLAPFVALIILWRCARPLLRFRQEPEVWAWLQLSDGQQLPVTHWESILGSSRSCDIILDFATVSRSHGVLTRYDDGSWSITDIGGKNAIYVNRRRVSVAAVKYGDKISLGGVELTLLPISKEQIREQNKERTRPVEQSLPSVTLLILTMFQFLTGLCLWMVCKPEFATRVFSGFMLLMVIEWGLFFVIRITGRSGFEIETMSFFLCTLGLSVIASDTPGEVQKQVLCILGGVLIYLIISMSLRNLNSAKLFRYIAAVGGIGLLLLNLLIGDEINGARNWIDLGFFTLQPSELVKLCFIYVGASTMDRIVSKRNVISFIIYSMFVCGCLVIMNDFGAALIFFITFLVVAYLRSGSVATIALAVTALVFAVMIVIVYFGNHVQDRFSAWGHVWEHPYDKGYQQTKSMIRMAVGGFFGVGTGQGWLKAVAASDTDLVFAFISEEWGLVMAVIMALSLVVPAVFVLRSARVGRSSFYTISASAAVSIMLTQAILNIFGTMDLLPLTGVTLPFVSNGGSSMLCCWGLVAFIKGADTRQNASIAVKTLRAKEDKDE